EQQSARDHEEHARMAGCEHVVDLRVAEVEQRERGAQARQHDSGGEARFLTGAALRQLLAGRLDLVGLGHDPSIAHRQPVTRAASTGYCTPRSLRRAALETLPSTVATRPWRGRPRTMARCDASSPGRKAKNS